MSAVSKHMPRAHMILQFLQTRQSPWYSEDAGQPAREQKLRLSDRCVEAYQQCMKHARRMFTSHTTLEYWSNTVEALPAMLEAIGMFCATAAGNDPRGLAIQIKGSALKALDRWALQAAERLVWWHGVSVRPCCANSQTTWQSTTFRTSFGSFILCTQLPPNGWCKQVCVCAPT
jgi:hypothetical protein